MQLNEGHAYTYDRDALLKMVEEALANARPKAGAAAPQPPAALALIHAPAPPLYFPPAPWPPVSTPGHNS